MILSGHQGPSSLPKNRVTRLHSNPKKQVQDTYFEPHIHSSLIPGTSASNKMSIPEETGVHVHDVIIVGGGPCGLGVAARLCEAFPAANFTDEEHQRYHWIRSHRDRASVKYYKTGSETRRKSATAASLGNGSPDMLVLDAEGDRFMARWDRLFKTFDIPHLRSPMFFHIDPLDRDGLLAYTHFNDRLGELREIRGCVGKEVSKHRKKKERARKQYV